MAIDRRDELPVLAFTATEDGRWDWASRRWALWAELAPADVLGDGWHRTIHPDDLAAVRARWREGIGGGRAFSFHCRLRIHGEFLPHLANVEPAISLDRTGWQGVLVEVAHHVMGDPERAEVAALRRQLAQARRDLEELERAAAHDLKEPLHGMSHLAAITLDESGDRLDEESRRRLGTIQHLAQRLERMIDGALQVGQVRRAQVIRTDVDLNGIVDDAVRGLGPKIAGLDVQVRVTPLPTLRCDPRLARQLLQHLILNAVIYNHAPMKRIDVGASGERIFVADNGIGIAPHHSQRIFRMFKRLHSRQHYRGGAGVGLAVARGIVERHGGELWIESVPGRGSVFAFTLGTTG